MCEITEESFHNSVVPENNDGTCEDHFSDDLRRKIRKKCQNCTNIIFSAKD